MEKMIEITGSFSTVSRLPNGIIISKPDVRNGEKRSLDFTPDEKNAYATRPFKSGDSFFVWIHNICSEKGSSMLCLNNKKMKALKRSNLYSIRLLYGG